MASNVSLVDPRRLHRNPNNPRLIFREDELQALEDSIRVQGILVPLTTYDDKGKIVILDGERRWRCALKLGLQKVPVIQQPKPDELTNLMMMFAIHHRRQEWDPLPTALKMKELEDMFTKKHERKPLEAELAELGSLTRGEVRRYRKLLAIPPKYRDRLLKELERPRSEQKLTVDHVLESFAAASILQRRGVLESPKEETELRDALISKFERGVIQNTVAPRKLARLSLAVSSDKLDRKQARRVIRRVIDDPKYGLEAAHTDSIASIEADSNVRHMAERLTAKLVELSGEKHGLSEETLEALKALAEQIRKATRV